MLTHILVFVLDLHPYYAAASLVLILFILMRGYFKFRVAVPENWLLYYGPDRKPLGSGFHFMPYTHGLVDMKPRALTIGLDELRATLRVDTYREGPGIPTKESVVTRTPATTSKNGVIISWVPDENRLGDHIQSAARVKEQLTSYLMLRPDSLGLAHFAETHRLGIKIVTVWDPRTKKNAPGSVQLAEGVEIPYEG